MEQTKTIGVCTMTKNQGTRLEEWVTYHKNLGFDKFIIFLDNCDDNSEQILKNIKNIDIDIINTNEIVDTNHITNWIERSHFVYTFSIKKYNYLDWISFIEVDEFIFPQVKNFNFKNFLTKLESNCLYINSWDFEPPFDENKNILGQSYNIWTNQQRFNSDYKYRGKSTIRPKEFSKCIDAHHFLQMNGLVSNEFKIEHQNYLQINYGKEVTIDDSLLKIFHFRNHTPSNMKDFEKIKY